MSIDPDEPAKLTEVEAKGASKTKANYTVLIISTIGLAVIFIGLLIYFA